METKTVLTISFKTLPFYVILSQPLISEKKKKRKKKKTTERRFETWKQISNP
jgi:hypothetical protein